MLKNEEEEGKDVLTKRVRGQSKCREMQTRNIFL